jgi:hypothetical protein
VTGAKLVEKFPVFYGALRFTAIFLQPINGLCPESSDGRHIFISRYLKPFYYYFHMRFFRFWTKRLYSVLISLVTTSMEKSPLEAADSN